MIPIEVAAARAIRDALVRAASENDDAARGGRRCERTRDRRGRTRRAAVDAANTDTHTPLDDATTRLTSRKPSSENVTPITAYSCPSSVRTSRPVRGSQMRTDLSFEQLATRFSSYDHVTWFTVLWCA